jgi:hypothetical protein
VVVLQSVHRASSDPGPGGKAVRLPSRTFRILDKTTVTNPLLPASEAIHAYGVEI